MKALSSNTPVLQAGGAFLGGATLSLKAPGSTLISDYGYSFLKTWKIQLMDWLHSKDTRVYEI